MGIYRDAANLYRMSKSKNRKNDKNQYISKNVKMEFYRLPPLNFVF